MFSEKCSLAFYLQEERVATAGRDRDLAAISELMRFSRMPTVDKLQHQIDWVACLNIKYSHKENAFSVSGEGICRNDCYTVIACGWLSILP